MNETQVHKGKAFKDLHSAEGIFVMPNAWNAGSACMLEAAGFPAVGTPSSAPANRSPRIAGGASSPPGTSYASTASWSSFTPKRAGALKPLPPET